MARKPKAFESAECALQMTPMIDIVFQLLIFFLVATKMRVPEGELEAFLPPDQGRPSVSDIDPIQINLRFTAPKGEPAVLFGKTDAGQAMTMIELRDKLKGIGSDPEMREKVPVIINADPSVPYKFVIQTLDYCKKAKFAKVNFAAAGQ